MIKRRRIPLHAFYSLAILFSLWEVIARLGLVSQFLLPPPSSIIITWIDLLSPSMNYLLEKHIFCSFYRLMYGFLLAAALGIPLGILMGISDPVYKLFSPALSLLYPIPSIAWVPVVILWLGLGDMTIITIIFLSAIFPIVYNVSMGVRGVDKRYIWAAQIMGAKGFHIFTKVLIPGAFPYIVTGLKLAMGGGWRSLVAAEMLSATAYGVGYMIFEARTFLAVEVMFSGIITLAIIGFILERVVFGFIERRTLERWGMLRRF